MDNFSPSPTQWKPPRSYFYGDSEHQLQKSTRIADGSSIDTAEESKNHERTTTCIIAGIALIGISVIVVSIIALTIILLKSNSPENHSLLQTSHQESSSYYALPLVPIYHGIPDYEGDEKYKGESLVGGTSKKFVPSPPDDVIIFDINPRNKAMKRPLERR